eukprot:Amastigsp_a852141_8.p3 type:complete len:158 gc:universal Amastigsp_a852141_8:834-361(-)
MMLCTRSTMAPTTARMSASGCAVAAFANMTICWKVRIVGGPEEYSERAVSLAGSTALKPLSSWPMRSTKGMHSGAGPEYAAAARHASRTDCPATSQGLSFAAPGPALAGPTPAFARWVWRATADATAWPVMSLIVTAAAGFCVRLKTRRLKRPAPLY